MSDNPRIQRLHEDLRTLKALRDESTIFEFVPGDGDPPDQFTLIFSGKGIRRDRNQEDGYAEIEEHRCELRLGHGYPERPPEMRWVSPIYHPNITYSGFPAVERPGAALGQGNRLGCRLRTDLGYGADGLLRFEERLQLQRQTLA